MKQMLNQIQIQLYFHHSMTTDMPSTLRYLAAYGRSKKLGSVNNILPIDKYLMLL